MRATLDGLSCAGGGFAFGEDGAAAGGHGEGRGRARDEGAVDGLRVFEGVSGSDTRGRGDGVVGIADEQG